MMKIKLVAFMGESGTGKDTIATLLYHSNPGLFSTIVSCTTRPIREGEIDGVNYYYLTKEQFLDKVNHGDMLEYNEFNGWYYGADKDTLNKDKINLGVFNPQGVRDLAKYEDIDLLTIYIVADDKIRLIRQLNREPNPDIDEIIRRYGTDKRDFENLKDIDYAIVPNTLLSEALDKTIEIIEDKFHI